MGAEERRKILEKLKYGDVIKYQGEIGETYLIVAQVKEGVIEGFTGKPVGVDTISIDKLVENERLSLALFNEL